MFVLFVLAAVYGLVVFTIGWTKSPKNWSFLGCGTIGIVAASIIMAYGTPSRDYPNGKPEMVVIGVILIIVSMVWLVASIMGAKAKVQRESEQKRTTALNKYKQKEKEQHDLAHTFGLEKYYTIDTDDARKYQEGIQAMRQLGMIVQQSVYQEKERDWAIHGGIAEGIAGPAAGIAAAANVMQDNVRIRAENAARREWGAKQNQFYQNLATEASTKRPIPLSMSELSRKYTVISSWSPFTLLSFIHIHNSNIVIDRETGSVTVNIKWSQRDRNLCIDGAIRAKLYTSDGKCAGCAYMVLPKTGTSALKGEINGVCASPKPSSTYTVKFEPVDLWELAPKQRQSVERPDKLSETEHHKVVQDIESKYLAELGD